MASKKMPTAAGVYARLSLDKNGDGLGVERQLELCRKLAADKGWTVAEEYIDNSVSAFNGATRPAYARMLGDLEHGRRDAVVCVDLDRLTRRPIELEQFMVLADSHGIALANVSGDTDLSTSDGRLKARIMGAVARQESEKKGERQRREAEQAARRGVPRGSRRPFGFEPDRVTVREAEAELIREAARRMIDGENPASIARDWNERGVEPIQGAKHGWSAETVAGVARSPRVAGLRAYKGEIVSTLKRPDGKDVPSILPRGEWEQLNAKIRRVSRPGRPAAHLLAGIARCSECDTPLWSSWVARKGKRTPRYTCTKRPGAAGCGKVSIVAAPLDEFVRDVVIERVGGPRFTAAIRRARGRGRARDRDAAKALTAAEAKLEELAGDYARGNISRREWMAARDVLQRDVAALRRELDTDTGPLTGLPTSTKALRAAWDAGTVEWRRAVLSAVVDTATVKPAARPGGRFDPARVSLSWRA